MSRPPKRRGLRFSLRTMLVLWTAVAVWLGWNVHVVHQRQALRRELTGRTDARFYFRESDADLRVLKAQERRLLASTLFRVDPVVQATPYYARVFIPRPEFLPPVDRGEISWVRRLMGDRSVATVKLDQRVDLRRVRKLFPEATISVPEAPSRKFPEPIRVLPDSRVLQATLVG